jgi:hypothetical protein
MGKVHRGINKWQIALLVLFAIIVIVAIGIPKHKVDYLEGGATYTTDIKENKPVPQPEPTPQTTQYTYHANDTSGIGGMVEVFEGMANLIQGSLTLFIIGAMIMIVWSVFKAVRDSSCFSAIMFLGIFLLSITKLNPVKWGAGI